MPLVLPCLALARFGCPKPASAHALRGGREIISLTTSNSLSLSRYSWSTPPRALSLRFAAGGISTPADAALMMQLGCDGVFVGSGIFGAADPAKMARAVVQATTHYQNPQMLLQISSGLGEAMKGLTIDDAMVGGRMAGKGN